MFQSIHLEIEYGNSSTVNSSLDMNGSTLNQYELYTTSPIFSATLNNDSLDSAHSDNATQLDNSSKEITKYVFQAILLTLVGVIGIVGNIAGIIIFSNLEKPLKFHWLMITLFIFDTILILSAFIIFSLPELSSAYKDSAHMYVGPKVLPFLQIAMTGALYCQIAMTIERYLVVCHPFYMVAKEWSVKRYIIPLVTFSIIYNLPKFFEIDTSFCGSTQRHIEERHEEDKGYMPHSVNETYYYITKLRRNVLYKETYQLGINILFMLIGPFLVLIVLNTLTLLNLKRYQSSQRRNSVYFKYGVDASKLSKLETNKDKSGSKSSREVTLVKISLAIVITSIFCHSIKWVPTLYEMIDENAYQQSMMSGWIESFEHVSHFLLVVDASKACYIYHSTRSKTVLSKITRQLSYISSGNNSKPRQYSLIVKRQSNDSKETVEINRQDTMVIKPMLPEDGPENK